MPDRIVIGTVSGDPVFRCSREGVDVLTITDPLDYVIWEGGNYFIPDFSGALTLSNGGTSVVPFSATSTTIKHLWMWGKKTSDANYFVDMGYYLYAQMTKGGSSMTIVNGSGFTLDITYFLYLSEVGS